MYRRIIAVLFSALLAVGILAIMLMRVWDDLADALSYLVPVYLVPALAICLVAWIARGWRYKIILERMDVTITVLFGAACIFLSQTVNLIVPARLGDLIRVVLLKHEHDATVSQGLSSLVVERLFDILSVAFLGLCAVIFVLNVPSWILTILVIPVLLGGLFFLILISTGKLVSDNRYIQYILTMLGEIREASLTPKTAIIIAVSSLLIWILDTLICALVSVMFRQEIPFAVILLAVVAGNLIKAVPLTPGGVGTYEFALAVVFELSGTAPAVAILIAVTDHLIKNVVTLAGGAVSVLFLGSWVIPELSDSIGRRLKED